MRFAGFAVLALALSLTAVQAHADGMIVGGLNCPQVPCDPTEPGFPSNDQLARIASSCISRYIDTVPNVSVFDEAAGLDGSSCLTTNGEAFPSNGKASAAPQCCIKKLPVGICIIHCDMIAR